MRQPHSSNPNPGIQIALWLRWGKQQPLPLLSLSLSLFWNQLDLHSTTQQREEEGEEEEEEGGEGGSEELL